MLGAERSLHMKIDMHCHVKEGSIDSRVSVDEYICLLYTSRAASCSEKTVSDGAPKSAAGKYFNIMCPESAAGTLERF